MQWGEGWNKGVNRLPEQKRPLWSKYKSDFKEEKR